MRERFQRWMYGRYGVDQFGRFLNILTIILLLISFKFRALSLPAFLILIYGYFRMFSRNHQKRYRENQVYLRLTERLRGFIAKQKNYAQIRKTHHLYSCPNCRQKIRVPKGKGRIAVRCPKCGTEFIRKS